MFRIFALALIVASTASAEMTRWASQDFKIISVEASSRRDLSVPSQALDVSLRDENPS